MTSSQQEVFISRQLGITETVTRSLLTIVNPRRWFSFAYRLSYRKQKSYFPTINDIIRVRLITCNYTDSTCVRFSFSRICSPSTHIPNVLSNTDVKSRHSFHPRWSVSHFQTFVIYGNKSIDGFRIILNKYITFIYSLLYVTILYPRTILMWTIY